MKKVYIKSKVDAIKKPQTLLRLGKMTPGGLWQHSQDEKIGNGIKAIINIYIGKKTLHEHLNLNSSSVDNGLERKQINQNIEAVFDFYAREDSKMSFAQRLLERISCFIGEPIFLALTIFFVAIWIGVNLLLSNYSVLEFDPPPFHFLQGVIGLSALLTATIVLSNQNRLARIEEQRAHLELKVNLLTEQKTAKMIELLEELRLDLPNVRNRPDSEATELKHPMNPDQVLAALDERVDAVVLQESTSIVKVMGVNDHKIESKSIAKGIHPLE